MFNLLLQIPFIIFVFNNVFQLVSLLFIQSFLIISLQLLRNVIRGRKFFCEILSMLLLQFFPLFLEFFFFLRIIELSINGVIIMGFPKPRLNILLNFLLFLFDSLFMVLIENSSNNIVLFLIIRYENFLSFHRNLHVPVLEVNFR